MTRPDARPADRARPRILLITEFFPHGPNAIYGAIQRVRSHLDALSAVGVVDLVFMWPAGKSRTSERVAEWSTIARVAWPLSGEIHFVPSAGTRVKRRDLVLNAVWACRGAVSFGHHTPSMRTSGRIQARYMRQILKGSPPDMVFAHRLEAGALLMRAGGVCCPVILDLDDLEHIRLSRLALQMPWLVPKLKYLMATVLARFSEARIVSRSDATLVCSDHDRKKLREVCSNADIVVAPNTSAGFRDLPRSTTPTALFVGMGKYLPNREAIEWFAAKVWPEIRAAIPEARFVLVGEGFETLALSPTSGIDLLGFQADLAPLYARARMVVCPIRRGGGTRIKIIEAAMSCRAVVSTRLGAEGLDFQAPAEILLADTPSAFAAACISVLSSPTLADDMGRAAQQKAQAGYSPNVVRERLMTLCNTILHKQDASVRTISHLPSTQT